MQRQAVAGTEGARHPGPWPTSPGRPRGARRRGWNSSTRRSNTLSRVKCSNDSETGPRPSPAGTLQCSRNEGETWPTGRRPSAHARWPGSHSRCLRSPPLASGIRPERAQSGHWPPRPPPPPHSLLAVCSPRGPSPARLPAWPQRGPRTGPRTHTFVVSQSWRPESETEVPHGDLSRAPPLPVAGGVLGFAPTRHPGLSTLARRSPVSLSVSQPPSL